MSRQFRIYALPSDVEALVAELRIKVGLKIIQDNAPMARPVVLDSPIRKKSPLIGTDSSVRADCYIIPASGADIRMSYFPTQSHWLVAEPSEIIAFRGCDYNGKILVCGRFYYQNDMLIEDAIFPKRQEFIEWADRIFATTKRFLRRSKTLDAYVGEDAEKWRGFGGRFVSMLIPGREPMYADE